MIPHFKNGVIHIGACKDCGDWQTDLSNKNCWFPKHKYYPTVKDKREGNGNQRNINIPKAPDESPVNEEDLLSPCRVSFKFLNQALTYAEYHFENKLWKNEMLEYLRTCCFSKNVAFNAIEAFQQGQEYHGPDIWQKYEEFGINILDFADTSMYLLCLDIKKYITSMIPILLKQRLRWNQDFGRLASKSLDAERMLLTGTMPTNPPTKIDQSAPEAGNHLTVWHSQGFVFQFTVILIAYSMKTN